MRRFEYHSWPVAFLLESNLIKRYRPHYNITRDQQRYTYLRIAISPTACCKTYKVWKIFGTGKTYGPFTHGTSKLLTIGMLRNHSRCVYVRHYQKKHVLNITLETVMPHASLNLLEKNMPNTWQSCKTC